MKITERIDEYLAEATKFKISDYEKMIGAKWGSKEEINKLEKHFGKKIPAKYLAHYRRDYFEKKES